MTKFTTGLLSAIACLLSCNPAQYKQVEDASDKREVICRFVETWSTDLPELKEVRDLCRAGEDLKKIAAAYAGCAPQNP